MLLSRIWSISVILEPMLLFVVIPQTGFGGHISRLIQIVICVFFLINFLQKTARYRNFTLPGFFVYKPYFYLLAYIITISIIYLSINGYEALDLDSAIHKVSAQNALSIHLRPWIEILIVFFQFFYFVILAPIFLKTKNDFKFFFKFAFIIIFLHFFLGWIDWALYCFYDIQFIPRHFLGGMHVGCRFHGLAGEPRDAAIFNMSIIFFLAIYSLFKSAKVKLPNILVILLILYSSYRSLSASFLVGAILSALLILFYFFFMRSSKINFFIVILSVIVLFGIVFFSLDNFWRIGQYYEAYASYIFALFEDPFIKVPYIIKASFNNVFPIIIAFNEFRDWNPLPLLFGSGLGSSGVANSIIRGYFLNPNNQLTRFIYEYGIIGSTIFFICISSILKNCTLRLNNRDKDILFMTFLLMLGGILAHRSNIWLIWLGLLCAVIVHQTNNSSSTNIK